jgi:hypothetical protein
VHYYLPKRREIFTVFFGKQIPTFLKNRDGFIFRENRSKETWTAWQWKSVHYDVPKRREVFAKWYTVSHQ